jgi:hypothetical protein
MAANNFNCNISEIVFWCLDSCLGSCTATYFLFSKMDRLKGAGFLHRTHEVDHSCIHRWKNLITWLCSFYNPPS